MTCKVYNSYKETSKITVGPESFVPNQHHNVIRRLKDEENCLDCNERDVFYVRVYLIIYYVYLHTKR